MKKREGVVVGVVEGCELGAGDVILRALIGPGGLPVLEISARYPRDMTVAIYDVTGRMVTSLYSGSVPAGVKCITWNGRDRMGRAVASGAYFARVFGSGATVGVARIVLIR